MDSLFNILDSKDFAEPPEATAIKRYVNQEFGVQVGVQVRDKDIIISVSSAALANTLRLKGPELKQHCQITKRLTFRIDG
jgi:hypothetical protein